MHIELVHSLSFFLPLSLPLFSYSAERFRCEFNAIGLLFVLAFFRFVRADTTLLSAALFFVRDEIYGWIECDKCTTKTTTTANAFGLRQSKHHDKSAYPPNGLPVNYSLRISVAQTVAGRHSNAYSFILFYFFRFFDGRTVHRSRSARYLATVSSHAVN